LIRRLSGEITTDWSSTWWKPQNILPNGVFVQHTKYEVVELEASDFTYSKMQLYVHEPSDQDPTDTVDPEIVVTF
jgi:hypothetical protein